MRHHLRPLAFRFIAAVAACSLLAACGGGGGSSSPAPTPTPTPAPIASTSGVVDCNGSGTLSTTASIPVPSTRVPSVYTIDANPRTTVVTIDGTPLTQALPYQYTPVEASAAHTVTFPGAPPVFVAQTNNGPHAIYFNAVSAASGSFNTTLISNSAVTRVPLTLKDGSIPTATHRAFQSVAVGTSDISQTRLIVKYRASLPPTGARSIASIERLVADHGMDIGPIQNGIRTRALSLLPGQSLTLAQSSLRANPDVVDVLPTHLRFLKTTMPITPSDTLFGFQWDMQKIGAPNAWAYPSSGGGIAGAGATVAILDTGIDNAHPDLAGKITREECVVNGKTYVGGTSAQDTNGHGTNVAGIVGDDTNNAFGFAGVGYAVNLQAYKIFPNETLTGAGASANTADEAAAIYDAVNNGASVINLSLGSAQGPGSYDPTEHDAVEFAIAHNVVVVAAAGNEATNTLDFPAAYDGVLSVGASALEDDAPSTAKTLLYNPSYSEFVPKYANSAPTMALVAPGGGCRNSPGCDSQDVPGTSDNDYNHWIFNISTSTAIPTADQCTNQPDVPGGQPDCKALFVGTSQATPHVSGTVGLIEAALGQRQIAPAQIVSLLENTTDDIKDPRQGHGRLNAYRALAIATGDSNLPTHVTPAQGFVAFAYSNGVALGAPPSNIPKIVDATYPLGVPVQADGSFPIDDVMPNITYRVGVWFNAHGGTDGQILPGDQFGVATGTCNSSSPCTITGQFSIGIVTSGFMLP